MKRPNEASVKIDYVEGIGTERQLVFTGSRADVLQMLASMANHPTRFHGLNDSHLGIVGYVEAFAENLKDELGKPAPFVDLNRLTEGCLDMATRLILYVEGVCWKPERWRKG